MVVAFFEHLAVTSKGKVEKIMLLAAGSSAVPLEIQASPNSPT